MSEEKKPEQPKEEPSGEVTAFTVLGSVFRAWFGVQKEENRKRDFSSNNPTPFIIAGIIFAIGMVGAVIIMVNIALSSGGH
ncbi:MAG TPA: DUF2970 domain-containing protein [Moraxellaceae bacterium]